MHFQPKIHNQDELLLLLLFVLLKLYLLFLNMSLYYLQALYILLHLLV